MGACGEEELGSINSQMVRYIEVLIGLMGVLVLAYVTLRVGLPWLFRTQNPGKGGSRCWTLFTGA